MVKKVTAVSSFSAADGFFFLSLLRNPTSSHYPSSFSLISLTRHVDEGRPPALAGGARNNAVHVRSCNDLKTFDMLPLWQLELYYIC